MRRSVDHDTQAFSAKSCDTGNASAAEEVLDRPADGTESAATREERHVEQSVVGDRSSPGIEAERIRRHVRNHENTLPDLDERLAVERDCEARCTPRDERPCDDRRVAQVRDRATPTRR